jgi:hypothetical protein
VPFITHDLSDTDLLGCPRTGILEFTSSQGSWKPDLGEAGVPPVQPCTSSARMIHIDRRRRLRRDEDFAPQAGERDRTEE